MISQSLFAARPGKTQACRLDTDGAAIYDLEALHRYGQSVRQSGSKQAPVLLFKTQSNGKETPSVTNKRSKKTSSPAEAAERLLRTLSRQFVAGQIYTPKAVKAMESVWRRVAENQCVTFDDAFLRDLNVLKKAKPVVGDDFARAISYSLSNLDRQKAVPRISADTSFEDVAQHIQSLPEAQQERLKPQLRASAQEHSAPAAQLLKALNWPLAAETLAPPLVNTPRGTDSAHVEEASEESPEAYGWVSALYRNGVASDASAPLGHGFFVAIRSRLEGLGIVDVDHDTPIHELARRIRLLPDEQRGTFIKVLHVYGATNSESAFMAVTRQLLAALG